MRSVQGGAGAPSELDVLERCPLHEAFFHSQPCLFVLGHFEHNVDVYSDVGGVVVDVVVAAAVVVTVVVVVSSVVCVCG